MEGAAQTTCPAPMKATSEGAWQGNNPLDYALPLAILQICLVVIVTRALAFLLKPLRQPRVIAEIIGGILLGPSGVGRSQTYLNAVFPRRSLTVLDTLANIGLLFFLFLVGLELDPKAMQRTGKKALAIAGAGITLPFVLGIATSFILRSTISKGVDAPPLLVFMGVALSITAFPVLARILAELKLLTTDVGRMAMSAAAVNDVAAWVLLALAIALSSSDTSPLIPIWVLFSGAAFVFFAVIAIRPLLAWMASRSPDGEPVKEIYICATLLVILAAGFATDTIGIHALFGAFVVGIVVPKDGQFAGVLVEKIEDLVSGLLMPLYFVSSGLKTNVATIEGAASWGLLVLVIAMASLGKIGGTIIASVLMKVPFREALALGILMNTKGLVELIVLNIGKDRKVLNEETFAILVLMALFTTFITTPLVTAVYKPARKPSSYTQRTIQRKNQDTELRILACLHSRRNVPSVINLIEAIRGTRKRGLCVYAMHLMELSERASAILMVHKARKNGLPSWNKKWSEYDQITVAFEAYQQLSSVSLRPMTAISELFNIHEDICTSAERKKAAFIILPFHKHQRLDGVMETSVAGYRSVNQKVLQHAPCSVGILVDRGLGGATQVSASDVSYSIIVLFFGGRDDREALAFGFRMSEHPGIKLKVVRFLPENGTSLKENSGENVGLTLNDDESYADDNVLTDLRQKILATDSVSYEEKVVANRVQTIAAITELSRCNMFLVGRLAETAGLTDKSDCPELGPVGSLLASPEYSTSASVLVVQQFIPAGNMSPVEETADTAKVVGIDNEAKS